VQIIDTGYINTGNSGNDKCPDTYKTNTPAPSLLTNWWTAGGCGINTNGTGLGISSLIPTSCGQVTIVFNQKWKHTCDTNTAVANIQGIVNVVAVGSLTPNLPAGLGGSEAGSDPPTYWVCTCAGDIIVTASSCPSLTADQLPDCWIFTGGVTIDKLHHKVSAATLANGPVTFTVTCGTSTMTIILKADDESEDYYVPQGVSQECPDPGPPWADNLPTYDLCGNRAMVNCEWNGTCCQFVFRYNSVKVGARIYDNGRNVFLFERTKHHCRIVKTWHLTRTPTPTFEWTITKYDCLTGTKSTICRTSATWDDSWARPADELVNKGYPTNSCENHGTPCL
jgi:hypothetical protein